MNAPFAARAPTMLGRAHVIRRLREALWQADFVEVDTPVFVSAPAPERYIDAVPVALHANLHAEVTTRYAQTSPELAMKQVLAAGLPRVYQLAAVLRDGDFGPHHRPEFRLLEWYRAHANWQAGMLDCAWLLRTALKAAAEVPGAPGLARPLPPGLAAVAEGAPIAQLSFVQAAERFAGVALEAFASRARLLGALTRAGLHTAPDDDFADLCHRLLVDRIEPGILRTEAPVFLTHYPEPLASFAALCQGERDPAEGGAGLAKQGRTAAKTAETLQVAERFELYACGLELANGFTELTSRGQYAERFAAERKERVRLGKDPYPQPRAFLAAADRLPPAVGVAMGLERLLMVAFGRTDIDDVLTLAYDET